MIPTRYVDDVRTRWPLWVAPVSGALRTLLVAIMCALTLSALMDAGLWSGGSGTRKEDALSVPAPSALAAAERLSLNKVTARLNRQTLFGNQVSARQGAPAPVQSKVSLVALLADYEVRGTILGPRPKVIVFDRTTSQPVTLGIGDRLGQIQITAIEREYVRFELLGDTHDVKY